MARAKSFKLKKDVTKKTLINLGFRHGNWQKEYKGVECLSKHFNLFRDIDLHVVVKTKEMEFDDFDDTLVLDDAFGQPYTPFYGDNYKKEVCDFEFLEKVIDRYNEIMENIGIFEKGE